MDGMIVRLRAKWLYEGEINKTQYFYSLEKGNFFQMAMCFIRKENGDIIRDGNVTTEEAKCFTKTCMLHEKMKL